ncbi:MAG: NusG domain II-containing protein [Clostridia bacterium]|nr:NusG domain II-containing protein [Clostridia bacterium]
MKGSRSGTAGVKRADVVIAAAVLLTALGLIAARLFAPGAVYAVVTVDGAEAARVRLDSASGVIYEDGHVTVVSENGAVRVADSDCPDKTCVRTGRLSRAGDRAVCVPNRTVVELTGGEDRIVTY